MRLIEGEDGNDGGNSGRYDVHRSDGNGRTSLHHLCFHQSHMSCGNVSYQLAERLLQLGADPNALDRRGYTPLHAAASSSMWTDSIDASFRLIRLLLEYGADLSRAKYNGWNCMHFLVHSRQAGLALLKCLYSHLPRLMSSVDYSMNNVLEFVVDEMFESDEQQLHEPEANDRVLQRILNLLTHQSRRQYADIQQALHQHTPLKLNDHSDLSDIVLSYIKARSRIEPDEDEDEDDDSDRGVNDEEEDDDDDEDEDEWEDDDDRDRPDLVRILHRRHRARFLCHPACEGWSCRGCSRFAATHPSLFAGCDTRLVPCPKCYGEDVSLEWLETQRQRGYADVG